MNKLIHIKNSVNHIRIILKFLFMLISIASLYFFLSCKPFLWEHYVFDSMIPLNWIGFNPEGLCVDKSGNIFVADTGNYKIQQISQSGQLILRWGNEGFGNGEFVSASRICQDNCGNIYVVDNGNSCVQKFDSKGKFLTKWGRKGDYDGQFGYSSSKNSRLDICVDSSGYVYVSDYWNNRIQKFDTKGTFILKWGIEGSSNGFFRKPSAICVDNNNNIYVADSGRIQKFSSDGTFLFTFGSSGIGDGQIIWPTGICVDSDNNIYVADSGRIQKFSSNGTFLIKWEYKKYNDYDFDELDGICVDVNNKIYTAERRSGWIQKFDSNGTLLKRWCREGNEDGQFYHPVGICLDNFGNLYIADNDNYRIQKFDSNGTFITKWGSEGDEDGQFKSPFEICFDNSGYLYVSDTLNDNIQKFDTNGTFITKWKIEWPGDAGSICLDSLGNIYALVDAYDGRIQKFDSNGTFLEEWYNFIDDDGKLIYIYDICSDKDDYLYISSENYTIFKLNTNGVIINKVIEGKDNSYGEYGNMFVDDNGNIFVKSSYYKNCFSIHKYNSAGKLLTEWGEKGTNEGQFYSTYGICVDNDGSVFVSDTGNSRIQKFVLE